MDDERAIVRCDTTKGPIVFEFLRHWSPHGYDRAVYLFEKGFYDHTHFFRAVPHFLVQFGITYSEDKELLQMGNSQTIPDDPQLDPPIPFEVGTISYAGSGPASRTSQLFFSLTDENANFGTQPWETPVGKVLEGIEHIQDFYHEYGDGPPFGKGPAQGRIHTGRAYIDENFPLLDSFKECHTQRIQPDQADETIKMKPADESFVFAPTDDNSTDFKLVGGGVLLVIVVWVFVRSFYGANQMDPNKKK
jgi:cyclophilin family peptidyl-prolyl cis-trans isomerase